jgi:hypothetical protein
MLALLERAEWVNQAELRVPGFADALDASQCQRRRSGTMVRISSSPPGRLSSPAGGWTAVPPKAIPSDSLREFFRDPAVRVAARRCRPRSSSRPHGGGRRCRERRLAELLVWLPHRRAGALDQRDGAPRCKRLSTSSRRAAAGMRARDAPRQALRPPRRMRNRSRRSTEPPCCCR